MTRIHYDCEFLEDGRTIDLISIGMVREDGKELYAVNAEIAEDPLYSRICNNEWLMENVVPHLPLMDRPDGWPPSAPPAPGRPGRFSLDMSDSRVLPRWVIRNQVRRFIENTVNPELWAWYAAYDHVAYAQLFGKMTDLPKGFPMHTCDLKQEVDRRGNPPLPQRTAGFHGKQHDCLDDARWLRTAHEWLERQS